MGIAGPDGTILEGLIFLIPRKASRSSSAGLNITHQTLKLPVAVAMEVLMVTLVQRGYTLYNVNKQPRPIAWTPRRSWTFFISKTSYPLCLWKRRGEKDRHP